MTFENLEMMPMPNDKGPELGYIVVGAVVLSFTVIGGPSVNKFSLFGSLFQINNYYPPSQQSDLERGYRNGRDWSGGPFSKIFDDIEEPASSLPDEPTAIDRAVPPGIPAPVAPPPDEPFTLSEVTPQMTTPAKYIEPKFQFGASYWEEPHIVEGVQMWQYVCTKCGKKIADSSIRYSSQDTGAFFHSRLQPTEFAKRFRRNNYQTARL